MAALNTEGGGYLQRIIIYHLQAASASATAKSANTAITLKKNHNRNTQLKLNIRERFHLKMLIK